MDRRKKIVMGMLGGGWKNVAIPDAAFNFIPTAVQQHGRRFRLAPSFNLQTYAGVAVSKEYYVDKSTGLDTNSGADWVNALKTFGAAAGKADVDRINIRNGYFYYNEVISSPTRSIEVIGDGTATITKDCGNEIGVYTPTDAHYNATVGGSRTVVLVTDKSNLNALGNPTQLVKKTSEAEVEAATNSWYQSGTNIYMHTFDGRAPDTDLVYYVGSAYSIIYVQDNKTFYGKNLKIVGACTFRNASSTGGTKVCLENCTLDSLTNLGVSTVVLKDCVSAGATADAINHSINLTVVPNILEIDCDFGENGAANTDQASTVHDGCVVVRINGKYHHSAGQNIADVVDSKSWCLGTEVYNSTSGVGFYSSGLMWLDCCWSHDNTTYDLENTTDKTIYIRDFIGAKGVNNIGGTLADY